jgi:hypothetical protein
VYSVPVSILPLKGAMPHLTAKRTGIGPMVKAIFSYNTIPAAFAFESRQSNTVNLVVDHYKCDWNTVKKH